MPSEAFSSIENEYWYNVSPQDKLPLAGVVDLEIDLKKVALLFIKLSQAKTLQDAHALLYNEILKNPIVFSYVRQFLGISDKRAYLDLSYIASRTKHPLQNNSISGCQPWTLSRHPIPFFLRLLSGSQGKQVQQVTANMFSKYLMDQGIYNAAKGFSNINEKIMDLIYTRLIVPKEYQQKAAKRRGHGCESVLAKVLNEIGVDIIPINKAVDPMGANDPHVDLTKMEFTQREIGKTHAFDIIITHNTVPYILIQSLIHTSDPGQFGVDKSNETVQIYSDISTWNRNNTNKVYLWGLFDGVGYSENKPDTINKLLNNVDHFVQIKTLYKAPLVLHKLGLIKIKGIKFSKYYDHEDIKAIQKLYISDDIKIIINNINEFEKYKKIECGEAYIYI
jgi:hypothetical protein